MGERAALGVAAALHRHRRRLAVAASVLLTGTALTAFGIAPMAPDAAQLPRRQIIENLEPPGLPAQLLALASYDMVLSRADQTRASDNVESLLRRLGVFDPQLATFMRANNDTRRLFEGRPGKQVQARVSSDGRPLELVARFAPPSIELANTHFTRLTITRNGDQWRADSELAKLDAQVRVAGGGAKSSLWRQIVASALGAELVTVNSTEGAAFGAALLAGVGAGAWSDVPSACAATISVTGREGPNAEAGRVYADLYPRYRALYPALRSTFDALSVAHAS